MRKRAEGVLKVLIARALYNNCRVAWKEAGMAAPAPWSKAFKDDRDSYLDDADAVLKALDGYLTHHINCRSRWTGTCTCGFEATLRARESSR